MNSAAIIGAGKFAYSLAPALQNAGSDVICIISHDINSSAKLARETGVNLYSDNINDIPANTEIIFITVPDSEIESVAIKLSNLKQIFSNKIFVHCSGALNSSELESLASKGASAASFHIMQTFPSRQMVDISGCYASIETQDNDCYEILSGLAEKMKLRAFRLNKEQKTAYHLAGVFACNFLAGNIFAATEVFKGNIDTYELLEPIIHSTLNNIKNNGAAKALSGPIDRGDYETIKKHISILKNKEMQFSYIAQSYILLRTAEKKYGELSEEHKKIKTILDDYLVNKLI